MRGIELNKIALTMGKVIKLLDKLQTQATNFDDVYDHDEDFCCIAYMCRVGILNRIQESSWIHGTVTIFIPTGIFSHRKETIDSGLYLTIGKLKELVSKNVVVAIHVDEILNCQRLYYQYDRVLSDDFKKNI